MSVLRCILPHKFMGRLAFIIISFLLAGTVFFVWNSSPVSQKISPIRRRSGSVNLILPTSVAIVDPQEDDTIPRMYQDFAKNPADFVKKSDSGRMGSGGIANIPGLRDVIPVKDNPPPKKKKKERKGTPKVNCMINNETKVTCLRTKAGEIYMAFKFIKQYFEVYGEFVNGSGKGKQKIKGVFYFQHSNAAVFPPTAKYTASGEFLYFKNYNVEGRSKVLLISGEHGVPVSNQWDKSGYIYPIQVAQYGLSHHAKLIGDGGYQRIRRTVVEDGTGSSSKWVIPKLSTVSFRKDNQTGNSVVYFNSSPVSKNQTGFPALKVDDERVDSCLSFDVKFVSRLANVSVVIESKDGLYVLTYHSERFYKKASEDSMVYGIGPCRDWCTLHRDLAVDFRKFLPAGRSFREILDTLRSIQQIEVRGEGFIDNIELSEKCHKGHFKDASDWMAHNQDSRGGWPITVARVITTNKLTLPPGWYSAMAQGQAMSLLVRAYMTYKKTEYLTAAIKGLGVYQNLSTEHGVRARFLDKYNWYEEYPTTPPLFVLNGFIYSLFGLYDLSQVAQGEDKATALRLYNDGMDSLKVMLNLFDSGTGTFYDLRHVTVPGMAPNRARWDYHAVHIAQLMNLATIDSDPIFNATADRWMGYVTGEWAPHN